MDFGRASFVNKLPEGEVTLQETIDNLRKKVEQVSGLLPLFEDSLIVRPGCSRIAWRLRKSSWTGDWPLLASERPKSASSRRCWLRIIVSHTIGLRQSVLMEQLCHYRPKHNNCDQPCQHYTTILHRSNRFHHQRTPYRQGRKRGRWVDRHTSIGQLAR